MFELSFYFQDAKTQVLTSNVWIRQVCKIHSTLKQEKHGIQNEAAPSATPMPQNITDKKRNVASCRRIVGELTGILKNDTVMLSLKNGKATLKN